MCTGSSSLSAIVPLVKAPDPRATVPLRFRPTASSLPGDGKPCVFNNRDSSAICGFHSKNECWSRMLVGVLN